MTTTNRGERLHIGLFGRRNAGKSSLINALTNQEYALVSEIAGTTADPVYKAMEMLPVGPVVMIDTAGLDDEGTLGEKRVLKTREVMRKCDLALIVIDVNNINDLSLELAFMEELREKHIAMIAVVNKCDITVLNAEQQKKIASRLAIPVEFVSASRRDNIDKLKKAIIEASKASVSRTSILGDIVGPGETAILVVPIDDAAPKGRLILPQVQTIRDLLDNDALSFVVKERELSHALRSLKEPPKIVITDSQAFQKVAADTPENILMTSFSILFARYKGDLEAFIRGINRIKNIEDGDKILIAEACTHHAQSDDIGTVKLPRWLQQATGKKLAFEKVSGAGFPDNLSEYKLILHCGSCMLNRRELLYRIHASDSADIPIVNYGMAIAYTFGILERALKPFPLAESIYNEDIY